MIVKWDCRSKSPLGIVLAALSTLIARTAFEISYRFGFYPEKWLADLTVGLLSSKLAFLADLERGCVRCLDWPGIGLAPMVSVASICVSQPATGFAGFRGQACFNDRDSIFASERASTPFKRWMD